jgi:hypothetical protein
MASCCRKIAWRSDVALAVDDADDDADDDVDGAGAEGAMSSCVTIRFVTEGPAACDFRVIARESQATCLSSSWTDLPTVLSGWLLVDACVTTGEGVSASRGSVEAWALAVVGQSLSSTWRAG